MFFRILVNKIIKILKEKKWHIRTNTMFLVLSSLWLLSDFVSINKAKKWCSLEVYT